MKIIVLAVLLIITPCISYAGISYESKIALKLHDYNKALRLLGPQAVRDNADAQYHLALLYRTGKGTKQNYKKAFYWFKRSANNGNVRAQYNCGILFENGYGVKPNKRKAMRWYKMAAKNGHQKSKAKLKSGLTTLKGSSSDRQVSLFREIRNKRAGAVKQLLNKKCSGINRKNTDGDTPLLAAIKFGNYEITKLILKCKADTRIKDHFKNTPLLVATHKKKSRIVKLLINRSRSTINTVSDAGITPLMKSALVNDLKSAKYLLRKGAKINRKDNKGKTAYNFAETRQYSKMMDLLESHGAKPSKTRRRLIQTNIKVRAGQWAPLITAAWRGQNNVIEALLKKGTNPNVTDVDGNTALIRAAERGHIKSIKLILKYPASINKKNRNGLTPIMAAAAKNKTKILDYLINKNAKINLRDKNGMSALMHSANTGSLSTFKKLLEHGAKISFTDKKKRTLLKIAGNGNHDSIVSYILNNNVVPLSKRKLKKLLLEAAASGKTQTIKTISQKGISINITDNNGNTPLIISSSKGLYSTSLFLIKNKANINEKNKHGNTALILAAQTGKIKIVKLLLNYKADTDIRNKNRKTALDLAKSNGYKKIIKEISTAENSNSIFGFF